MNDHIPVLLSIHPRHAEAILAGAKTAELRRRPPRQAPPYAAVVYATAPTSAVVGHVMVVEVLRQAPADVWHAVEHRCSVSREEFRAYFGDLRSASALLLEEPRRIEPRLLHRRPPQSWRYLSPVVACDAPLLDLAARHLRQYRFGVSQQRVGQAS